MVFTCFDIVVVFLEIIVLDFSCEIFFQQTYFHFTFAGREIFAVVVLFLRKNNGIVHEVKRILKILLDNYMVVELYSSDHLYLA